MCCSEGLDVKLYLQQSWQDADSDDDNGDDDDDGHEGTSGAVKLYLQQMSQLLLLTVIWLSLHLTNYLARQTFVFDEISFLHFCICILVYTFSIYFCICIWPNIIFVLLSLLHLSKHTVLDAPYFRKGHSHSFTWRQTNASESKSKYVAQTQTRIVAFNICDKDLKSSNICIHCALVVYIMRYMQFEMEVHQVWMDLFMHWNRSPDTCILYFVIVFMDTHQNISFA